MGGPPGGQLFPFVQLEYGFLLGPSDGRYLVRGGEQEPERVVVLRTLGAPGRRRLRGRRPRRLEAAEPEPVPTARATIVRAQPFADEAGAARWLDALRTDAGALEREVDGGVRELNAVLRAHRAAAEDPYARDVDVHGALAARAGYGSGDQVADGRFAAALAAPRRRERERRLAAVEPQGRLASILGGRERVLAGEELLLRARADLAAGRMREAALQARIALEALIAELPAASSELAALRERVSAAANAALGGELGAGAGDELEQAVAAMRRALRRRGSPPAP